MISETTRLRLLATHLRDLRAGVATHRLDLCFGSIQKKKGGYYVDVYLEPARAEEVMARLSSEGIRFEVIAETEEDPPIVSTTNRYTREVPRGVGIKR